MPSHHRVRCNHWYSSHFLEYCSFCGGRHVWPTFEIYDPLITIWTDSVINPNRVIIDKVINVKWATRLGIVECRSSRAHGTRGVRVVHFERDYRLILGFGFSDSVDLIIGKFKTCRVVFLISELNTDSDNDKRYRLNTMQSCIKKQILKHSFHLVSLKTRAYSMSSGTPQTSIIVKSVCW